ncbi:MAG: amino-acid N-acetyltransferase [Spirochaetaceae bacterium]|nr:amino-acid N-acetyltransferase [Spirochaetaceae bacterium]
MSIYNRAERIRDVIRYIKRFKNALMIIHFDEEIITSPFFSSHIRDISLIHQAGIRVAIIPGAKKRINTVLSDNQIPWKIINQTRITEENAMPLIKMAAFDVSNQVMTSLAGEGITAVIGNWVRARGMGVIQGIDFSTAGEIDKLATDAIKTVLDNGFIPIFPCIGWNSTGKPYNISSFHLASEIAIHLQAEKLFYITPDASLSQENCIIPETIGLSPEKIIPSLNLAELETLISANKQHKKDNPLLNLLELAKKSCQRGVTRVHLLNGTLEGTIPCEIFSDLGSGTMIYQSNYGCIRSMKQEDIPHVLSLIRPFVEEGILLPRSEELLLETFHDYIVYELDDGIRACAAFHQYDNQQGEIACVAVDPTCTHMGIGPKIISFLTSKAQEQGNKSVFVLTTKTADWFEKQGFIQDGIETLPNERREKWNNGRNSKLYRKTF